ncbi:hypothetical protein [Bacillus sp. JCM 19034]|nr:hypothetical protein [Bacillus sp. JCM 19034]
MTGSIVTREYRYDWENQYTYEKKRILQMIGDKIVRIKHIGGN